MENSKTRAANFTSREEEVLISLAKKYINIIECKRCDASYNRAKAVCWMKIKEEYNRMSGEVYRSIDALKKKYDNIKTRAKRKWLEEKTGRRNCLSSQAFTKRELEVLKLLGPRLKGLKSRVSDDTEVQELLESVRNQEQEVGKEDSEFRTKCSTLDEHDYTASTSDENEQNGACTKPQDTFLNIEYIEEPSSPQDISVLTDSMKVEKDVDATSNFAWADAAQSPQSSPRIFGSNKLSEEQHQEYIYEEAQLRLRNLQEEHELRMELLRQKTAAEIRIMERICAKEIQVMEAKADKEIELMVLEHRVKLKTSKK